MWWTGTTLYKTKKEIVSLFYQDYNTVSEVGYDRPPIWRRANENIMK